MTKKYYAYNDFFGKELEICHQLLPNDDVIYKDLITPLAQYVRKMTKNGNNQINILFVGRTGSGKSNDAIQFCRALDPKFSLRESYIYSAMDFVKKLKIIRSGGSVSKVSLFDEGSVSLNSMNSQKRGDVALTICFDTLRSFGLCNCLCIPNERHLNKRIGENHLDFMFKCPNISPVKGYSRKGFVDVYTHVYRDWADPYWDPIGTTIVEKLPPRIWEEYQTVKKEHQFMLIDSLDEGALS